MEYSKIDAGKRVKKIRKEMGMSQENFGEKCNVYQSEISKLENGKLQSQINDFAYLSIISSVFNIPLEFLLFGLVEKGNGVYMKVNNESVIEKVRGSENSAETAIMIADECIAKHKETKEVIVFQDDSASVEKVNTSNMSHWGHASFNLLPCFLYFAARSGREPSNATKQSFIKFMEDYIKREDANESLVIRYNMWKKAPNKEQENKIFHNMLLELTDL